MGSKSLLCLSISCLLVFYKCYWLGSISGLMLCSVAALSRGSLGRSRFGLVNLSRAVETAKSYLNWKLTFIRPSINFNGVEKTVNRRFTSFYRLSGMMRHLRSEYNVAKMSEGDVCDYTKSENYVFATVPEKGPKCTLEINWQGKRINLDRLKSEPVDLTVARLKRSLAKLSGDSKDGGDAPPVVTNFCVGFLTNLFKPLEEIQNSNEPPTIEDALRKSAFISINDSLLQIYTNVPRLASVTTSERAMVGCPIFAMVKFTCDDCTGDLDIHWLDEDDVVLHNGPFYYPRDKDVGREIRALVKCDSIPHVILQSPAVPVSAAPECAWQKRRNDTFNASFKPGSLRVVSFNILSPTYMQSLDALAKFFPYCPAECMDYNYRSQLVLKELQMLNAHIICLQECASNVYNKYMQPAMVATHHCLLSLKNPTVDEGCAMFVSRRAFDLLANKETSFKVAIADPKYKWVLDRLTPKWRSFNAKYFSKFHTVYQFGAFYSKAGKPKLLIVANTHLYFHPHGRHVRLLQSHVLMTELNEFKHEVAKEHGIDLADCATIICGDFNVSPEDSVYQLMTEGEISFDHPDWSFGEMYGPDDMSRFDPANLPLINADADTVEASGSANNLDDVRSKVLKSGGTGGYRDGYAGHSLEFTNFVQVFNSTLDYIFFKGNIEVNNVLQGISKAEAQSDVALPCRGYPSDHLSIAVDFHVKDTTKDVE